MNKHKAALRKAGIKPVPKSFRSEWKSAAKQMSTEDLLFNNKIAIEAGERRVELICRQELKLRRA